MIAGVGGLVLVIIAGALILDAAIDALRRWGERQRERDRIAVRRAAHRSINAGPPTWRR